MEVKLPKNQFSALLKCVDRTCGDTALSGIFVKALGDKLTLAATDTHILVELNFNLVEPVQELETFVRVDAVESRSSRAGKNMASLDLAELTSRETIDGQFPEYQSFFDQAKSGATAPLVVTSSGVRCESFFALKYLAIVHELLSTIAPCGFYGELNGPACYSDNAAGVRVVVAPLDPEKR